MFLRTSTYLYIFSVLTLIVLIYAFETKVDEVNSKIATSKDNIRKYNEDINVFEAEWSYQNSPERLTKLVTTLNVKADMAEAKLYQYSNLDNLPEKDISYNKTAQIAYPGNTN